jgi:LacI family transcriptional regulator
MTKKRVTIKEVAREAGVSIQTVSRVLNDLPHVAPETRDRVLEIIDRLQYRPSALARSLIQRRSMMLGVVTAGLSYIGPSRTLSGITAQADAMGYDLLLHELPDFETADLAPFLNTMVTRQIDGVIWAVPEIGGNRQWLLEQLPDLQVPLVFLTMHPQPGLSIVSVDNYKGARLAIDHLIAQGYRHIGHVAGPLTWWEAQQRKAGWSDALAAAGLPAEDTMWVEGNWSSRSGESVAAQLFDQYPAIDAVFVANDQMALSLIALANRLGRTVPDHLAVVGFDGIAESAYFIPPLTTVQQGLQRLGATAVQQLVSIVEAQRNPDNHHEPQAVSIEPVLIVRDSSPPTADGRPQTADERRQTADHGP